jgi:hypothetical protein
MWVVTSRKSVVSPPIEPCDAPNHALGFSSPDKLVEFLNSGQAGRWMVRLVGDRPSFGALVDELQRYGATGICLDPAPDGSGGVNVPLADLLQQAL